MSPPDSLAHPLSTSTLNFLRVLCYPRGLATANMTAPAFFERYKQLMSLEQSKDNLIEVDFQHNFYQSSGF